MQDQFDRALPFYRDRGGVLFVSYCRFWEQHGFVQQSLARFLTDHQVPVTWLDAAGWRPYSPTLYWNSPYLTVRQITRLPGERFPGVRPLSIGVQVGDIIREVKKMGNPVLWIQAGLERGIAEKLPYIDVFSTFDDPYRHPAEDPLCERSRLIICQNRFTEELLSSVPENRRVQLSPPVDLRKRVFSDSSFHLPASFPKRVMGYIGSFLHGGYDNFLMEYFIRHLPDWGFLMMGRTDDLGMNDLNRLRQYPNFIYYPWAERAQLAAIWSRLDLSLLLYRNHPMQDGAYPVKLIEGLHFGVPAIGTQVNKNRDIADYLPCNSFADQLIEEAVKTADWSEDKIEKIYDHFREATDPRQQLVTVARRLG